MSRKENKILLQGILLLLALFFLACVLLAFHFLY